MRVAEGAGGPASERSRALRAQCAGWLAKPFAIDELVAVVWRYLRSGPRAAATGAGPRAWLCAREREVAGLVALGRTNREIADALVLTEGTVANHVRRILLKTGAENRTQLAVLVTVDSPHGRSVSRTHRKPLPARDLGLERPRGYPGIELRRRTTQPAGRSKRRLISADSFSGRPAGREEGRPRPDGRGRPRVAAAAAS
jgi:DNA-binding CsgD family transcriptional regulator